MPIVLQEIVAIDRGGKEAYLEAVATRFAADAENTRGMRLLWLGSTIGSTAAWPETIALWELRDWRHYADVCARMYTESNPDEELRSWWLDVTKYRRSALSRTLVSLPFSPTRDDHLARGLASAAFAFTTYRLAPDRRDEFVAALERRVEDEAKQGRRLFGAYEVAFTNDLAYAIWTHASPGDIAAYEETRDDRAWSDGACVSWSEHWGFTGARVW